MNCNETWLSRKHTFVSWQVSSPVDCNSLLQTNLTFFLHFFAWITVEKLYNLSVMSMYVQTLWQWNEINQYLGSSEQKIEGIYSELH